MISSTEFTSTPMDVAERQTGEVAVTPTDRGVICYLNIPQRTCTEFDRADLKPRMTEIASMPAETEPAGGYD